MFDVRANHRLLVRLKVKGLHKTLKPVSSTHSLDSSFGSTDHSQASSRKTFTNDGVFNQGDVLRSLKSTAIVENGHTNRARMISSSPRLLAPSESVATVPTFASMCSLWLCVCVGR